MGKNQFAGKKAINITITSRIEQKVIAYLTPKVPSWIQTHHLTISLFIWTGLIIYFNYLAATHDIRWLWGVNLAIVCRWLADALDGSIGRYRNTGLVTWGYYVDHFADYLFTVGVVLGYSFHTQAEFHNWLIILLGIWSAIFVQAHLMLNVTNKFEISFKSIGPTELLLILIAINFALLILGPKPFVHIIAGLIILSTIFITIMVFSNHRQLWKHDKPKFN